MIIIFQYLSYKNRDFLSLQQLSKAEAILTTSLTRLVLKLYSFSVIRLQDGVLFLFRLKSVKLNPVPREPMVIIVSKIQTGSLVSLD